MKKVISLNSQVLTCSNWSQNKKTKIRYHTQRSDVYSIQSIAAINTYKYEFNIKELKKKKKFEEEQK